MHTPLVRWWDRAENGLLWFKPENLQRIGSFKLRGAYNKIASLSDEERQRGVVAYSSGNHAQGVALAARMLGVRATIVMPHNAPRNKVENTAGYGAEIVFAGHNGSERQARAEALAREKGYAMVPPFNDEAIIAGQGTIGLEIVAAVSDVDCVLAPVGGGGLIGGTAAALKLSGCRAQVIGVEPELAADAHASLHAGHIVEFSGEETSRTLADGLRAQHVGEVNFEYLRAYVDEIVTVSEGEIREAMRRLALEAKLVAEPSGAVPFAAWLFHRKQLPPAQRTVAVISGGNVDPKLLAEILR